MGDFDDVAGGYFPAEIVELIDDAGGELGAEICGDEVCLKFVPIDLGLVGDAVEEFFEEACHVRWEASGEGETLNSKFLNGEL